MSISHGHLTEGTGAWEADLFFRGNSHLTVWTADYKHEHDAEPAVKQTGECTFF